MPDFASVIDDYVQRPLRPPNLSGSNAALEATIRPLKIELLILDDLEHRISKEPLGEALQQDLRAVDHDEARIERAKPGIGYLEDSGYWADELRLQVLERLFRNWALWTERSQET